MIAKEGGFISVFDIFHLQPEASEIKVREHSTSQEDASVVVLGSCDCRRVVAECAALLPEKTVAKRRQ